ncbi:MAG: hypothetical protein IPK03_01010 [Bacteroidetes bacterium]|nr:hypothetical protein [Bacteroidota bacterium]
MVTLTGSPLGASIKDFGISINTTALKDSIANYITNNNTVKDSIISLLINTLTADNGLTKTGTNFKLGGTLIQSTTIATSGANTLAVSGLQSGTGTDSILVSDPTTGVIRRRSPATILSGATTNNLTITGNTITSNVNGVSSSATLSNDDSTTASNGLNIVGKDVRMGGALTGATTITTTGANTLAVSGLQSGSVADSILVADATTGVMRRRSPESLLNATTTNIANSNGNIHTSTVNGITDTTTIINSNSISISGNTITSNVNGVSSSATLSNDDSTTASNGLNIVGKDVRMGGALTGATTITTTGANTLAVSGLQSGTGADSILVADATTGVMRRRSPTTILAGATTNTLTISGNTITSNVNGVSSSSTLSNDDSTTASNGLNIVGKDVRMGGALTGATTITTTGANTLAVSGLQSGTGADSILVADATTGVMRRRSPTTILAGATTNTLIIFGNTIISNVNGVSSSSTLSNDDSTTASNGLNIVGKDVRMGGALTGATTITTTGANTLAVSGLQSGTAADSILVADATTGVMRRRSPTTILAGATTNTLTISGNTITSNVNGVSSSSTLSNDDSTTASNGLNLVGKDVRMGGALTGATTITTTGANTLAVSGLQSGTAADSILVADATTGVMRRRSPTTILAGATTNTLTISGNTITSNVNGVSSSSTLSNDDSTTASNGLNLVGKDVRMGGALTSATTITTTGANTLAVSGLQSGTGADSILVADATTGVMRRRSPTTILAGATTNTLTISGNTITSNVNGVSSSSTLSNDDSTTASNGLNLVGKDVRMGGALTGATTITTTGANTLAVSGLQSRTSADSILVADATTGVMRRRSPTTILAGATTNTLTITGNTITSNVNGVSSSSTLSNDDSTTASNGLNLVGKDVRMGGALTSATTITTTGANTLAVSGLQSGTGADSILVADASTGCDEKKIT